MTDIELLTLINDELILLHQTVTELNILVTTIKFVLVFYVMWFCAFKIISVYKVKGVK